MASDSTDNLFVWQNKQEAYEKALFHFEAPSDSNKSLSESQVSQLKQTILHEVLYDEATIKREMDVLRTRLHQLETQSTALRCIKRQCLPTSCTYLPADILLEIFKHSLAPAGGRYKLFQTNQGPWLFSHVCRHWRDVMLSTPTAWTSFFIERDTPKTYMTYLNVILSRSATSSINFEFDHSSNSNYERSPSHNFFDGWGEILSTILEVSHRWKNAQLVINAYTQLALSTFAEKQHLPTSFINLESLVAITTDESTLSNPALGLLFSDAPKLVDVTLEGYDEGRVDLPYAQLKRLSLTSFGEYDDPDAGLPLYLSLLSDCPRLTELDLSYYIWEGTGHHDIFHPTLAVLTIADFDILQRLRFPALQELSIIPRLSSTVSSITTKLDVFLDKSHPHRLHRLSIENLAPDTDDSIAFCHTLRGFGLSLQQLHFHYSDENVDVRLPFFWKILHELTHNPATILPSLEHLSITNKGGLCLELYQPLLAFIAARWDEPLPDGLSRLKSVRMVNEAPRHLDYSHWETARLELRRRREEGLDIELDSRTGIQVA